MTSFRPTRRYPNIPAITDDLRSHTLALRALAESVNIYTRATQDIRSSFVRVGELVDLGLITLDGNSNGSLTTVDLSEIAGLGDLSGATEGDFLRYRSGEWVNDGLDTADITSGMVTQHEGALTIDWSQLSSVPSTFTPAAHVHDASDITTGSFDHGGLTGLADDDHAQYLPVSGSRAMTGTLVGVGIEMVSGDAPTSLTRTSGVLFATVNNAGAGDVDITASSFVAVNAFAGANGATVTQSGNGGFIAGSASGAGGSGALISAGTAGIVIGAVNGGTIEAGTAASLGNVAGGYAATAGRIRAVPSGIGSGGAFAFGTALGADITASGQGSFSGGYALFEAITASGSGAFAWGYTEFGLADIAATATNAVQFGPGTNAVADSVRIGSAGLHFKGTTGAFGTQLNGQMWMGSTGNAYVMVRSNGADVRLGPVNSWTTGAHATRRDFTGTTTATEALELLETLVEDLRASNII